MRRLADLARFRRELIDLSSCSAEAHQQDGDQTHTSGPEVTRFEEGKENSHLATDSKDQRSIANKVRSRKLSGVFIFRDQS